MKFLARAFLLILLALPVAPVAVVWLCLQDAPLVVRKLELTPQDIANAKRLMDQHDPRTARANATRRLVISEQEFDLLVNYAASRYRDSAARASLGPGLVRLQASAQVPRNPFGRYLNVDATLRETAALPRIEHIRIGRLTVPPVVADYLLRQGLHWTLAADRGGLAADIVKGVRVADGRLTVTYVLNGGIGERARSALLSSTDQARLRAYHERLVEAVANAPGKVSLAELLPPLFRIAIERGSAGDVVAESRAAFVVLAFYANGIAPAAVVPAASQWAQPARRTVTLAGRDDFAKHFLISAAISATAGSPLADAIGLYKEIEDSRGGSGFSFNDIGADRAGTRLGEIASRSPQRALRLAQALAGGVKERDFMPDVSDLPEFMPEAEFLRRYGGIDGAGYKQMMATIEARIESRPLLR